MNYFIYGARRSGKTTKALDLINVSGAQLVLFKGSAGAFRSLPPMPFKITREPRGLREDTLTWYDDYPVTNGLVLAPNSIFSCTPDNHEDDIYTPLYFLYLSYRTHSNWKTIHLPTPRHVIKEKKHFPETIHLGNMYGYFYEERNEQYGPVYNSSSEYH